MDEKSRIPRWLAALNEEDLHFLKRFLLASGSLKAIAAEYGVSYPTIRNRLDRLIRKVQLADEAGPVDPLRQKLRLLVADGVISAGVARDLLAAHKAAMEDEGHGEQADDERAGT